VKEEKLSERRKKWKEEESKIEKPSSEDWKEMRPI